MRSRGVALIMVLLVLSALAIVGAPFVVSMALQDRASLQFSGAVAARFAAEGARNHAIAQLERTVYGVELESEAEALEEERPDTSIQAPRGRETRPSQAAARPRRPRRRGLVVRRDAGEVSKPPEPARLPRNPRNGQKEESSIEAIPERLKVSKKGPSPREFDLAEELTPRALEKILLGSGAAGPAAQSSGSTTVAASPGVEVNFQDPSGVVASALVSDEQGKVNLNTAPPNLIANLFGVTRLVDAVGPTATKLIVEDASVLRGDSDPSTIDGAVVLVDPDAGAMEAVAYRTRDGDVLGDCARGAFLSLVLDHTYPAGTFVYDLRGWKVGYHRLWAEREGGFQPERLTEIHSIEGIRDIARWQIASLFVTRFRGEGLTMELLRSSGVSPKKIAELGLDPYLFGGDPEHPDDALRSELESARRRLRKLGLASSLIEALQARRGARVVIALAARLEGADRKTIDRLTSSLEGSLGRDRRSAARLPERYLIAALKDLAELYATPGIETVGPEELEALREVATVTSWKPALWSEPEAITSDLAPGADDPSVRLALPRGSGAGTILRIEWPAEAGRVELNEAAFGGKNVQQGGVRFALPLFSQIKAYETVVSELVRHPVNINTAPRRVLRAILTGVRGHAREQIVSPAEADRLAARIEAARPIRGHAQLLELFEEAADSKTIDDVDVEPLLVNAVCPTSPFLVVSTTGFCYASGDVYSIECRGSQKLPAGLTVAEARFREIVEVSAPRTLQLGLLTQADFTDGTFLKDPYVGVGFPELRQQYLLEFPGVRSHLVTSRPLLLHRVLKGFAGGDLGDLRLFPSETPETARNRFTLGSIEHFRNTFEGYELGPGEPWVLDLALNQGGGPNRPQRPGGIGVPSAGAGGGLSPSTLNMVPGGFELWFRMRTKPDALSREGHRIIFDAGVEEERNRIQVLYAERNAQILLRIYDSSLPDPSIDRRPENGQYLEVAARRALELETWYHLRALWDGTYGGGAQLFLDGFPVGTDNLSTELTGSLPAEGGSAISVRDASKFPREGVVRIDQELFEYRKSGSSLQIRQQPPPTWTPLPRRKRLNALRPGQIEPPPPPGPEGGNGRPGRAEVSPPLLESEPGEELAQAAPAPPAPQLDLTVQRAPGNRRGSVPSAHQPGARVSLHGYALEIRRKIRDLQSGAERQIPDGDGSLPVWSQGGLRSRGVLNAFNFPVGMEGICNLDPGADSGSESESFLVPLFHRDGTQDSPILGSQMFTPILDGQGQGRNAADYFQDLGVCSLGSMSLLYKKETLPPIFVQMQARLGLNPPQTMGLKVLSSYPPAAGQAGTSAWQTFRQRLRRSVPGTVGLVVYGLTQRSLQANGRILGIYPPMGLLELRGSPTPWELQRGRRDCRSMPLFQCHPDDAVEWIRYAEIFEQPFEGEDFHLFVGRSGQRFRGYPERDDPRLDYDYRKQLDHLPGEPLRLVMELSEGGAGWGDYVTISGRAPGSGAPIYEPALRRVYKVLEHEDGRFFASLVDVNESGQEQRESLGRYQQAWTMAMFPRLVKFPTWSLPDVPVPTALLFGDTLSGQAAGSRGSGVRDDDALDQTGITIDEVQKLRDPSVSRDLNRSVRHVLVPLQGSTVLVRQGAGPGAFIEGRLPAERKVSRSNPLDVLVVTLSRERGVPSLFAPGVNEGVLRIGDELFYFEAPQEAGGGGGAAASGRALLTSPAAADPNAPNQPTPSTLDLLVERSPLARSTLVDNIPAGSFQGKFEQQGFARIEDINVERFTFHEVFFYKRLGGGGFSDCLRGQFGTPILENTRGSPVVNVSRKLRLVGRSLLGTTPSTHTIGDAVTHVPYVNMEPILGPMTATGIAVKRPEAFGPAGHLLLDSGEPGRAWEIVTHLNAQGEGLLQRPRDERGKGILRASFGTREQPVSGDYFAYQLPYRYPDRYEAETDSASLAFLQKSFRVPGAYWRGLEWRERLPRATRERRSSIVIAARFDGAPGWDATPTNKEGGLYIFEDEDPGDRKPARGELNRWADQLELRIYFKFPSGAFTRLPDGRITDDWKETPILDALTVEYEKAGAILRHEELPF